MGRPRKRDADLPACVYFKHNAYYLVRKNVWSRLGRTKDVALRNAELLMQSELRGDNDVEGFVLSRIKNVRAGAKKRGLPFELSKDDILSLVKEANGRCTVTHTKFSLEKIGNRMPFAPSIDRKDSSLGYTRDNCRIVCTAANFGMNCWGDAVLAKIAANMALKMAREMDSIQQP